MTTAEQRLDILERRVMDDCEIRRAVPGYWSDWFSHLARVLAYLHEWRAHDKSVEQWLDDLAKTRGDFSLHALIEHFVTQP